MKKLLFSLVALCAFGFADAQIIQSSTVNVETSRKSMSTDIQSGYRGFADAGVGISHMIGFNLITSHGYQFNSGLFLGLATGFEMFDGDEYAIPLLANARYYLIKKKLPVYTDMKVGYNIEVEDLTGINFSLGFGIEIHRFQVGIGYQLTNSSYHGDYGRGNIKNNAFRINLGINF